MCTEHLVSHLWEKSQLQMSAEPVRFGEKESGTQQSERPEALNRQKGKQTDSHIELYITTYICIAICSYVELRLYIYIHIYIYIYM